MVSPKEYIRDGRAPLPNSELTSRVMSSIKSKNTVPEIHFRRALFNSGIKGYRIHYNKIPGHPDICFLKKKIAIFINGCFWHRCEKCNPPIPKSHNEFWQKKFSANIERDKRKITDLINLGWSVIIIWECEVNNHLNEKVEELRILLNTPQLGH